MERQEDEPRRAHLTKKLSGQSCRRGGTARARRAGLPRQSPARGAPDRRRAAAPHDAHVSLAEKRKALGRLGEVLG
jgi:hypothetical protein